MLVQALVPELAVEALDVAVLHWSARLYQEMENATGMRPGHESTTGELRAVVGPHCAWVAPEGSGLVQQPGHVLARNTEVGGDIDAFVTEVVGHRQALDAPAVGQAVADKVHAPHFIY